LIVFVSIFRGVKLEEKTIQCEANLWNKRCTFEDVTFTKDTKLKIERIGAPEATDEDFDQIMFWSSFRISLEGYPEDDLLKIQQNLGDFPAVEISRIAGHERLTRWNEKIVSKELFMHSRNLKLLHAIHTEAFDNLRKLTSLGLDDNSCVD
jgi:hypothetical protein